MPEFKDISIGAGEWFLSFFKDFIGTPAILVGIFSMLGSILLRKKTTDIIMTFFKTVAGFLIISGGASVLVGSLTNFQILFDDLFKLSGAVPNNEGLAGTIMEKYKEMAQLGSIIMVISMILNIGLAYFSRFKYIYLSGHVLFYMSIALAAVMSLSGFDISKPDDFTIALISSSLFMSLYMVLSCAMLHRWTKIITKQNDISLAHTGAVSYAMGGLIGELVYKIKKGENIRSTEEINFPKWLQFFRNTFISVAITMIVLFLVIYIPEGIMYNTGIKQAVWDPYESKYVGAGLIFISGSTNWLVRAIVEAFTFAAGVEIILLGVRMVIAELVPSFKGISEKLIKDSKAGIDCPIVFPFAPNAVLIGFVCSFIGAAIGLSISIGISNANPSIPVIIPGIVAQFFLGATTAVFANARGGLIAAVIASFLNGILITLVPIIFYAGNWVPINEKSKKFETSVWGDTDYLLSVIPGIILKIKGAFGKALIVIIPILTWLGLVIDGQILKIKNNQKPSLN